MANRLESPSSINTFNQCKRKYYYSYIEKLPSVANIHQVRGNIAHSVLENFFDIDVSEITGENYALKFRSAIQTLCIGQWRAYGTRLRALNLAKDRERFYFEETMLMLMNWANQFITKIEARMKSKNKTIIEAFNDLTPIREMEYKSENRQVRGFIDAIRELDDEIHIIDYKTNSRFDIKDSIRLQLAIYSLLYFEKHGQAPHKVGIFFLRHKLKMINVDEQLLKLAREEVELIHAHTGITAHVADYPRTVTGLCKWKTGQCDYYETCKPHG